MNQILEQAKSNILQKADQRLHPVIDKIVKAGEQLMYSPNTRHMLIKALGQKTPELIGASFGAMAIVLFKQAGKELPMQALVPAATILLCEGLQFMEDGGASKVDNNFLASCAKSMGQKLLELLKATPDKLQGMVDGSKSTQLGAQQPPAGIVTGAQGIQ